MFLVLYIAMSQAKYILLIHTDLNRFPSYSISLETHSDGHYSLAILLAEVSFHMQHVYIPIIKIYCFFR